ncbi:MULTISPECIES: preprotein translocase subunit SecG [Actinomycetaceae]|uniref:Protein-export membrane protein SecG n=1 Tax=Gleimia europaea ACS-120-V-Col10b TaxID=883069 RepID=A0A9W5RDK0_9ACTO|nr:MULTISPECIES: preprotein translocase subunit SecG [Actinomycetaceae]EPD30504.1 preprotein translocase, SecG subunit [Gleimia europaea ACS-120-V-Col10b]KGF02064.1 preprotein translocase subunit SecG [Actinomyces sp. S4-C9]MDK7143848.1 preprotein translocase subunit SecG [Gleimia europaea]MDU4286576.1 preprotein translocase subunit SecG [Actinomyces sp.]MDU5231971.1 preprotein translocase subunit SecG [Actinomyces sp.]
MTAVKIILDVLLVISSLFLILTILMHKGRGGGLSDMFGGGFSSTAGSSGVAERNLNRITIGTLVVWVTVIVLIGILTKFA